MQPISNVISALRCCFGLEGGLHCSSCPYDSLYKKLGVGACDQAMAEDAVQYLEMCERMAEKNGNS